MLLSSCHTEDNNMGLTSYCNKVTFALSDPASRATIDDGGTFAFSLNDQISLYSSGLVEDMTGVIATVTADNGLTFSGVYTYDGNNPATFYAVYPANAANDANTASLTVKTDQSEDGYLSSHFLWCKTEGNSPRISLTFSHAMAMIRVSVPEGATNVKLTSVLPTAIISFSEGEIVAGGETCAITMHKISDTVYQALVPPQTLVANNFTIEVTIESDTYCYTLGEETTLTAGHVCKFTLDMGSDGSSDEFVFPENSLIQPIVAAPTKISGSCSTPYYNDKWTQGKWYYFSYNATTFTCLSEEGGGFKGSFNYNKYYNANGYEYPCVGIWSEETFDLTDTSAICYTLSYDVQSEKDGVLGVAVFGFTGSTRFFYHALTTNDGVDLDSKYDYLHHTTTTSWKHVEVIIDPSCGTPIYKNYINFVQNEDKINNCVLVFYSAHTTNEPIYYSIKNIIIVPKE